MSEASLTTAIGNQQGPACHYSRSPEKGMDSEEVRLIRWYEMWPFLYSAKRQGNSQIVGVFLDSLFEEAMFDDEGAWLVTKTESFQGATPAETNGRADSNLLH